jgi:hypothetical protein
MEAAREGMTVRDADGVDIGTVALVRMSDPGVVTGEGQDLGEGAEVSPVPPPGPGIVPGVPPVGFGVGGLGAAGGTAGMGGMGGMGVPYAATGPFGVLGTGTVGAAEPDVPTEFRDRLIRTGYLKIDSKGLFRRDLYVGADQLHHVQDDTITLTITKDHLIRED